MITAEEAVELAKNCAKSIEDTEVSESGIMSEIRNDAQNGLFDLVIGLKPNQFVSDYTIADLRDKGFWVDHKIRHSLHISWRPVY